MAIDRDRLYDKWFNFKQKMEKLNHLFLWKADTLDETAVEYIEKEVKNIKGSLTRIEKYLNN